METQTKTEKKTKTEKAICSICGKKYNIEDIKMHDDKSYCEDCYNDSFIHCNACLSVVQHEYAYYWNDEYYCRQCYNEIVFICDDCGEETSRNNLCRLNENDLCEDCANYRDEDSNENASDFQEYMIELKPKKSETFSKNKFKEFCGVEIETLNDNLHDNSFNKEDCEKYSFSQIRDGSLNNNGVEFVSNIFNGDLLLQKIETFSKELNNRDYSIDKTCGLHIHVKIPKTIAYLKKVYLFYKKYENYFFEMLPKSRQNNLYCYKISDVLNTITEEDFLNFENCKQFEQKFYGTKNQEYIKQMKKEKYNNKRYSWVNFHSVFYRGTLELRSHSGTINPTKIKNWFLINLTALNFVKGINAESISLLPNSKEFFLSLFDKDIQKYIKLRWNSFIKEDSEEDN